jgi:hypothetical protein
MVAAPAVLEGGAARRAVQVAEALASRGDRDRLRDSHSGHPDPSRIVLVPPAGATWTRDNA